MSKKFKPFLAHSELTDCIYIIDENDKYEVTEQCISAMKATNRMPRWIPVSERLPEDGRPVLIYAWSVHHVIARYDSFRTENGYKKCWVTADAWNGNTEIKHKVIAWMPLPEPYQPEIPTGAEGSDKE